MKNIQGSNIIIKLVLFFIFLFIHFSKIYCALGCMDNSYHLANRCDYKNYHYVSCTCPCKDITENRGRCRQCYHFGAPFRGELNSLQLLDNIFR